MRTSPTIVILFFFFFFFFLFYGLLNAQEPNSLQTWWGLSIEPGAFGPTDQMNKHMINNNYNGSFENWLGGGHVKYPQRESPFTFSMTVTYGADINSKSKYELLLHIAHLGKIKGFSDDYYTSHFVSTAFQSISFIPTLIYAPFQFGPAVYLNNTQNNKYILFKIY